MSDGGICKDGLQVEAKAFTEEEREAIAARAKEEAYEHEFAGYNSPERWAYLAARTTLRWDATLRAVEAERDALRTIVAWYCPPASLARAAEADLRTLSPARRLVIKAMRTLLLPEVAP